MQKIEIESSCYNEYCFEYDFSKEIVEVFGDTSPSWAYQMLRDAKVLRRNQGHMREWVLVVSGTTKKGVQACLERLLQYIAGKKEDYRRRPPTVTREQAKFAGPCDFCSVHTKTVWLIERGESSVRFCDNCFSSTASAINELKQGKEK